MKKIYLSCFIIISLLSFSYSQEEKQSKQKEIIIIYGSDDCHHCLETKAYLKGKNLEFIFYDIDKNKEALKEMLVKLKNANINTSNLGIPVVEKNGMLFSNNGDFKEFLKKLE